MAILSNREKKFLANTKLMNSKFFSYSPQASIFYEYCRGFESEDNLFARFKNIRLKIVDGYLKNVKSHESQTQKMCQNSDKQNTNGLRATSNIQSTSLKLNDDGEWVEVSKSALSLPYERVRLFNSKQNKLKTQAYSAYNKKSKSGKITNISDFCRQKNNKKSAKNHKNNMQNINFGSVLDLLRFHRTIYHELGHSMVKHTICELDKVGVRVKKNKQKSGTIQMVCFNGKNAVYSYEINSKNKINRVLWRNPAMKYLEDGVVDNIAVNCVENEMIFSDSMTFSGLDKIQILEAIQSSVNKYSAFALVGLWECVSDYELTKQHFGGGTTNLELEEATEIFKAEFADFVHSVLGKSYTRGIKQVFNPQRAQIIAQNYAKCVNYCKKRYAFNSSQNGEFREISQFVDRLDLATNIDNLMRELSNFIDMNAHEEKAFYTLLSECLGRKVCKNPRKKFEIPGEFVSKNPPLFTQIWRAGEQDKKVLPNPTTHGQFLGIKNVYTIKTDNENFVAEEENCDNRKISAKNS